MVLLLGVVHILFVVSLRCIEALTTLSQITTVASLSGFPVQLACMTCKSASREHGLSTSAIYAGVVVASPAAMSRNDNTAVTFFCGDILT